MDSFDYISSIVAAAVYEHSYKMHEHTRLQNILLQLEGEAYDMPGLPESYVNNLSVEEKRNAISELKKQMESMRNTPNCDMLVKLGWYSYDKWSSAKLGIGVERGFYAVPFYHKNGDNIEFIIAFRGSDNVFNWIDNLREFSAINMWPIISQTLVALKKDTIPDINISAMQTTLPLPKIAATYTDKIRTLLRSDIPIRFAGHSLGGYLAMCESLRTCNSATVFENPGFPKQLSDEDHQHCQQNLREFLSEPNAVNTMGYHAGKMFLTPMASSANGDILENNLYRKDVEKFGPISLRISGLNYLVNVGAQSLNPIAISVMSDRLKKGVVGMGKTAGIVAGSGFLFCMFSDLMFKTNLTSQMLRYAVQESGHIVYNGIANFMSGLIEEGGEYLTHYLPFIGDTKKSHSMDHMIKRAFTLSGEIQNAFMILYQGKQACWPQADTSNCVLSSSHLKLKYAITGKALAITFNSHHKLYDVVTLRCSSLYKEQDENNQMLQYKKLQLHSNQEKLQDENERLSRRQLRVKDLGEQLKNLSKRLEFAREERNNKSNHYENAKEEFYPHSRRLEKIRVDYHEARERVYGIKDEIKIVEKALREREEEHAYTLTVIRGLEKENLELNKAIKQCETNASKSRLLISDIEIVHIYLKEQGLKNSPPIGVLSSGMYGKSTQQNQSKDTTAKTYKNIF